MKHRIPRTARIPFSFLWIAIALQGLLMPSPLCSQELITPSGCEVLWYFDPDHPPIIEQYASEKGKWELTGVFFDSDGDWTVDQVLTFLSDTEARIRDVDEAWKGKIHLYAKADFREAFQRDMSFRRAVFIGDRLTERPTPEAPTNKKKRGVATFQALLKRLPNVKPAAPPKPQTRVQRW